MSEVIQLPQAITLLSMPLGQAMQSRRTNRAVTDQALTLEEVSALLWAVGGVTSDDGRRTCPSTLDLRAVQVYVLNAQGVWLYDGAQHTLTQVKTEDIRKVSTAYQFELVETAPLSMIFVADLERSKDARPQGVWVDAGTMAQNAYLAMTALGLAGTIRASFDHGQLGQAMGLASHLEPIIAFTVGRPQ